MFDKIRQFGTRLKTAWNMTTVARWLSGAIDDTANVIHIPNKPYNTDPWVHVAVSKTCDACASVPLKVTTLDGDLIEDGPLVEFIESTEKDNGVYGIIFQLVGHRMVSGEAHIIFDLRRPGAGTIDIVGGYNMKALLSQDGFDLLGWEVKMPDKNGQLRIYSVDVGSVITWREYCLYPGTRFRGLSRFESLSYSLAEDEASAKHNATLLSRGGGLRGLLKTEQPITQQQSDELAERFDARYGGVNNTGKVAVLGRGTEWQNVSQSNRDMLLIDSRKYSRETILAVCNVPPSVIGIYDNPGKAHDSSSREGWYVNDIWPLVNQVGSVLTRALVPRFTIPGKASGRSVAKNFAFKAAQSGVKSKKGLIIWGDMSQVPALRNWHWQQAKTMTELVTSGIPLNEAIEKMDLPFTPDKVWGDTWWVPTGLLPAESIMANADELAKPPAPPVFDRPGDDDKPEDEPDEKPKKDFETKARQDISDRWQQSWIGLANKTQRMLKSYFFKQRQGVLSRLERLAPPDKSLTKGWEDDVLPDLVKENEKLIDALEPRIKDGIYLGGEQIASEINGVNPFTISDDYYENLLPQRFVKVVDVNLATITELQEQFKQSTDAGESLSQIQTRVRGVFKQAGNVRALRIARTETATSVNQGRKTSMVENGTDRKGWLDSGDMATRESHLKAGSDYGSKDKALGLDDAFIVGGYPLDHPSDPSGPAQEVINCRCTLLPFNTRENAADLMARYKEYEFVSYERIKDKAVG